MDVRAYQDFLDESGLASRAGGRIGPSLLTPSPAEESTPEERPWRVVMRMHGIDPSTIEDIVHSVRIIKESEEKSSD